MTPKVRYTIIVSAALLVTIAFALSNQAIPSSSEQWITKPLLSSNNPDPGPGFALNVTPLVNRARPGDPLDYELIVIPDEGFDDPISLRIKIESEPVFRGTYDLGVLEAPYPGPYKYRVNVPEKAPAPLTVKGTLYARGGDHVEVVELVLYIIS